MQNATPIIATPAPSATKRVTRQELPPITTRFDLGPEITDVQRAFLDEHGFLVFNQVARPDEVARLIDELNAIERLFLEENRSEVNGIPIFRGRGAAGEPFLQRLPFTSLFSDYVRSFVLDERFEPVRKLIGEDARVGHEEKDGLVANRNLNVPGSVYPRLGWHTDGLRDLFYLRMPQQMLNVGLHLDRVKREDGGLRIIPGSHKQGFWDMCFRKAYFVDHRPDPAEIAVETEPGDLTVHDGRTWHRVQQSPHLGLRSLRRTMYVPYLTDEYQPKHERSRTPPYHHLGKLMRTARTLRARQRRPGA